MPTSSSSGSLSFAAAVPGRPLWAHGCLQHTGATAEPRVSDDGSLALGLIRNSIHPTSVMSGYRLAMKESIKFIKDQLVVRGSAPNHPVFPLFLSWRRPQPANAGCGYCNAPSSQPSRLFSLPAGIRPTRPCQRHRGRLWRLWRVVPGALGGLRPLP